MNSLISVNEKFFKVTPRDLVQMILKTKYTRGIELYIDALNEEQLKYLDDLSYEIKRYDLILQIHANYRLALEDQLNYFKRLEKYADYLGYPIVITIHPLYDDDKEKSYRLTADYLGEIINNIDNNKLVICLENLNDVEHFDRLEKETVTPIILNNENLYFTYDLGHELMDYGNLTTINEYLIDQIRNIHIHTNDGKGTDHLPIYKNDVNWSSLLKMIIFLINHKYKYNIVYEYEIFACKGDTLEERITDYLESIDFVTEHYYQM